MSFLISSITINTSHLQSMLEFYGIVGFQFKASKVDKGSEIYRATHNGLEFSLYAVNELRSSPVPVIQLEFNVASVDVTYSSLLKVPGVLGILDPREISGGRKAILLDPDGNSIELTSI